MSTLQEEIDTLITSIAAQQATLLTMQRQQWWLNHPEIQSLSYSWEIESDDEGSTYKSFTPRDIKFVKEAHEFDDGLVYDALYDDIYPGVDNDYGYYCVCEVFTRPEVLT